MAPRKYEVRSRKYEEAGSDGAARTSDFVLRTYFLSMVTDSIVIGLSGRSPGLLVATLPILLTTSMPSVTSPKTLCLSSSHGVGTSVMKNCPPLVFGPELAIDRMPALLCRRFGLNSSANL